MRLWIQHLLVLFTFCLAASAFSQTQPPISDPSAQALIGPEFYRAFDYSFFGCETDGCAHTNDIRVVIPGNDGVCNSNAFKGTAYPQRPIVFESIVPTEHIVVLSGIRDTIRATFHEVADPEKHLSLVFVLEVWVQDINTVGHVNVFDRIRKNCLMSPSEYAVMPMTESHKKLLDTQTTAEENRLIALRERWRSIGNRPKQGKPTYTETASWLMSHISELNPAMKIISMDNCVLAYEVSGNPTTEILLKNVARVDAGQATSYMDSVGAYHGGFDPDAITFTIRRSENQIIGTIKDEEFRDRAVKAFLHAATLCQVPSSNEPF